METRPILVLFGLLAAASAFAQAYKWVDDDGVTHYSDVPTEGAEEVPAEFVETWLYIYDNWYKEYYFAMIEKGSVYY